MRIPIFIKIHKRIFLTLFIISIILGLFLKPSQKAIVLSEQVKRGDIVVSLSANGAIAAKSSVNLSFPTSGILAYLGVKRGDVVSAYQTLAVLDQKTTEKNLQTALRNYSLQRNTFEQAQDNYQDRTPNQALNDAMKRILQNNQYDLEKSVLSVELQQLTKEQSILTTPITGIVTRMDVESIGVYITSSTVFTVTDPTSLVFKIDVDEADIGKVKKGQTVKITLDAHPDEILSLPISHIDFTSHTTATGANAYTVEVNLPPNENFYYRVGMNGDAEIIISQVKNTLYIPSSSIVDGTYAYKRDKEQIIKQSIVTGIQNDMQSQVVNGLQEGDTIIMEPANIGSLQPENPPFIRRIFR